MLHLIFRRIITSITSKVRNVLDVVNQDFNGVIMEYLFTTMKDGWHELQMLAQEDWDKECKNSCIKAIRDIAEANIKRAKLTKESKKLEKELLSAYDDNNQEQIINILGRITNNLR